MQLQGLHSTHDSTPNVINLLNLRTSELQWPWLFQLYLNKIIHSLCSSIKTKHQSGSRILSTAWDPRWSMHLLQETLLQQGYYSDMLVKSECLQSNARSAMPDAQWELVTSAGAENTKKTEQRKTAGASCIILIPRHTLLVAVSPAGSSEPFCLTLLLFDGLHKSNFTPCNREQKV